ncbi:hypothetical protein LARV_01333 [Longilinea arvoryzae]|uniref:Uncharacterized protein n=1 Tax=Longilinea arvoryzae TaxID=360412 RepID=A0A0S7BIW7_9CHLR|nr:hypothetical protein [Longilinea arvoryzae]GAP13578.1 hypothetical protein LARV_01333 [Longilinea arvoryzae]
MKNSKGIWKKTVVLTLVGDLAFWLANFAISRTSIAAEYRAAMSISYYPMLLESLIGGLTIGFGVSYSLLCFFDRIPVKDPILKSVTLSAAALVIVTILPGGPSSFYATNNVVRYFIISTVINVIRILALGLAIGCVYKRKYKNMGHFVVAARPVGLDEGHNHGIPGHKSKQMASITSIRKATGNFARSMDCLFEKQKRKV